MLKGVVSIITLLTITFLITGCARQENVNHSKLTVGKVQTGVKKGMYTSDVIKSIGSPNIITRDKDGNITWVYDKISTYYSKTGGGLNFVRMNNNDFVIAGGILAGTNALIEASSSNFLLSVAALGLVTLFSDEDNYEYNTQQKTITIILDFNKEEKLEEFAYNYSSF